MRSRQFLHPSHFVLHNDSTIEIGQYFTHIARICDQMYHYLEGEDSRDPISGHHRWRDEGNDIVFRLGNVKKLCSNNYL
jgi:hypothetical protein